ncbi:MAG: hypothetical protein WDO70_07740 [Alphaproteobacteria bacterium]
MKKFTYMPSAEACALFATEKGKYTRPTARQALAAGIGDANVASHISRETLERMESTDAPAVWQVTIPAPDPAAQGKTVTLGRLSIGCQPG